MIDIAICIVPKIDPYAPTAGPSALKAQLESEGFSCKVLDFNIDLYNFLDRQRLAKHYYFEDDSVFENYILNEADKEFKYPDDFNEFYSIIEPAVMSWIADLKAINAPWVGLSLLSSFSCAVATKLCELIRKHLPATKIVIGGGYVQGYNQLWVDNGIVDYFIFGDGEHSLTELLRGNVTAPGINTSTPTQVKDLDSLLTPDYSDIDWSKYQTYDNETIIYVTGSRGCVKRCTFCDVPIIWPNYTYRSGPHIANEIFDVVTKYNRQVVRFTDSLINGSMRAFRELLNILKDYNATQPDYSKQIKWQSQWIVRPKNQSPEEDFALMKASGVKELEIGVESFSQSVRYHMGKKFADEDLWWCLEMLHKYEIPYTLLMIVGYPTETAEDHQTNISALHRMRELGYLPGKGSNSPTLPYVSFGNTMLLSPGQKAYKLVEDELEYYVSDTDWKYKGNDLQTRLTRFIEINELVGELTTQPVSWMIEKARRQYEESLAASKHINT